jgi:hypothetical protein
MSIRDLLEKSAASAIERLTTERAEDLLAKMEARIPAPSDDAWKSQIRGMSLDAIGKLKPHAAALAGHTREGLTLFLTYLANGEEHEALQVWLRDTATPIGIVGALLDAGDAAVADKRRRDAYVESAKELGKTLLRELGPLAARYLLPLLIQAAR